MPPRDDSSRRRRGSARRRRRRPGCLRIQQPHRHAGHLHPGHDRRSRGGVSDDRPELRHLDHLHPGPHPGGVQRHQHHRGHARPQPGIKHGRLLRGLRRPPRRAALPPEFAAGFKAVHEISPDYFTLEELVGAKPDFLFAGWNYGLQVGTNLTPANLEKYGIKTLVLTESCAHVQASKQTVSIDNTYQDLTNLGQIFDVPQRANAVIDGMKAQVAAAQAKVANLPPVTVFDYDSGTSAPTTGAGLAMPTSLISLGGGTNIFAGLKQSFTNVSWEQVVKDNPQCILINDYSTPTAAQKENFLETSPITKNLTAVKNHCFLALPYDQITPSPRNGEAVDAIAKWLHPAAYGLPADGS